jgi:hypothetical protein
MRNASHGFWLCIAAAVAVTVIAVPAASASVHKYDSKVTITHESGAFGDDRDACHTGVAGRCVLWHGEVFSEVRKCERNRRVVLFKQRRGADRKLGVDRTGPATPQPDYRAANEWGFNAPSGGDVYVKVRRAVRHGDVCLADRTFSGT